MKHTKWFFVSSIGTDSVILDGINASEASGSCIEVVDNSTTSNVPKSASTSMTTQISLPIKATSYPWKKRKTTVEASIGDAILLKLLNKQ